MKLGIGLALAAIAALASAQGPQRCSGMRVRRNAASLSNREWQSIANVLRQMNNDGWIRRFGASHDRLFSQVHGNTCFFPFHRRYVLEFENIGRTYDPNFVVPYWDATESYRSPAADSILSSAALGTNGQGDDRCLQDGVQGEMQMSYPDQHCMRRSFDQGTGIGSWYAPEIISSYIQSDTSLATFRENIEFSIHGAVHLGLGGEMDTGYAAHDFSFMVHHANLDRLWWDWQNAHNSFLMYDGPGPNGPASLSDTIPEDNNVSLGGATVESVMVLGFGNVCYTYDSSTGDAAAPQGGRDRSVFSGSSNAANRMLESDGIAGSLANDIMNRVFPGFATRNRNRNSRRSYKERPASGCGSALPFPPRLKPEWIQMHGYDAEKVENAHKHACEIVEILNNSTYVSPY
ncbi:hypothetical protein GGF46_000969 [Coemansia sp. RSA 552]|nr:hypothetical protein GGF46_000969 [Coemansia sp. RSA 552]